MCLSVSLVAAERAFSKVPGWWPRAYLSLLLFRFFRDTNYTAFSYMLREKCRDVGLGKSTLYKGLETLLREGLIIKKDSLYILTEKGYLLLKRFQDFEDRVRECVEARDLNCLSKMLSEVEAVDPSTEFEKHGKIYLTEMIVALIETFKAVKEVSEVRSVAKPS